MFESPMTLDRTHRVLTAVVLVILAGVFAALATTVGQIGAPIIGFVTVALAISWAMSPRKLVIADSELRVERRAWPALRVPLSSVTTAEPVALSGRTLRLVGVGGFFGSYGLFTNGQLGRFRLYATRRQNAMIVRRSSGLPIVITPDDIAGAVKTLGERRA
jgi:hypothetical protein